MRYFFIIFCICFCSFCFLSFKYNSPYRKLTYLIGKPGSGKSTRMVHDMIRDLKRGWIVYTDMEDCSVPGVRIINYSDLANCRPEGHSSLYLDEIGLSSGNRDFKNFEKGLIEFYKKHRHFKCKVMVASQALDSDKKIRDVSTEFVLQQNIGSVISVSRPIARSITLTEPQGDSESRVADKLKFRSIFSWKIYYMPRYFKFFDSFSIPDRPYIPYRQVPIVERKKLSIKVRKHKREPVRLPDIVDVIATDPQPAAGNNTIDNEASPVTSLYYVAKND